MTGKVKSISSRVLLIVMLFVCTSPMTVWSAEEANGFHEDFSEPVLDPSWTVLDHLSPNTYSLMDNPGHLRYKLDAGTLWHSWPNYRYRSDGYRPSVAIVRSFEGKAWVLEAKATYDFTQYTNGRQAHFFIVFKTGEKGTGYGGSGKLTTIAFTRDNDLHVYERNSFAVHVVEEGQMLDGYIKRGLSTTTPDTWYIQVTRQARRLSVELSEDGVNWFEAFPPVLLESDPGDDQTITLEAGSWYAVTNSYVDYDYINVEPVVIPVLIDIKPGSDPNSINLKSNGVVPVAVLTSDDFDASTVDPATVLFADASPLRWTREDVDGDGDGDLLFHFRTQELNLDENSTEAVLIGDTTDGLHIKGTDGVNIVPKGKK